RIDALTDCRFGFSLEPHMEDLDAVVSFLQDSLRRTLVCNESDLIRIGTALHEAVVNANEHGNLELSSDIRESDPTEYHGLVKLRARQKPYSDRRVYVGAEIFQDQAVFVIRDEGSGFEHAKLPDPTQSENIGKVSGRGLFLIRTFMDDVSFNAKGNEITLVKRVGFSAVDNCRETGQVG
ncbi:MAG: ATP-binding protein, partial [Pirellulaceae bacterium]|nr:ATP-binding protein [Pirellulaceae bacterium]